MRVKEFDTVYELHIQAQSCDELEEVKMHILLLKGKRRYTCPTFRFEKSVNENDCFWTTVGYTRIGDSWLNSNEEMIKISKKFPNLFFTLYGSSSAYNEYWVTYYKNGKFQSEIGEIVYPQFDEKKLRQIKTEVIKDGKSYAGNDT